MNTTSSPPQVLLDAVTEQIMRCCPDLDTLAWFTSEHPSAQEASASIGRLLRAHPHIQLIAGSPLAVWSTGGALNPHWRAAYPPAPRSAWANLTFLTELYPAPELGPRDEAVRLLELQHLADAELAVA